MNKTKQLFFLLLILLTGAALRLHFFTGFIGSDDIGHCHAAYKLMTGDFNFTSLIHTAEAYFRFGVNIPTAVFFRIFGANEAAAILFPLFCSLGSILLMFYFTRMLADEYAGLFAAFLMALNPLDIIYSTILLPDVPLAFFQACSVFLFFAAHRQASYRNEKLYFFFSGLLLGYCWMIKETGFQIVILYGLCFLYQLFRKKLRKTYALIALGLLPIIFFEAFFVRLLTGQAFSRFTARMASQRYQIELAPLLYERFKFFDKLVFWVKKLLLSNILNVFLSFGVIAAVVYALKKRKKEDYFVVLWLLVLGLVFIFSIHVTYSFQPRRIIPLFFPAILLITTALFHLRFFSPKRTKYIILCLFILATLYPGAALVFGYKRDALSNTRQIKEFFDQRKWDKPVWVDLRTAKILYLFNQFKWNEAIYIYPDGAYLRPQQQKIPFDNIQDSFIVVDRGLINWQSRTELNIFPELIYDPPRHWRLEEVFIHPQSGKDAWIYYAGGLKNSFFEKKEISLPFSDFKGAPGVVLDNYSVFSYDKKAKFSCALVPDSADASQVISIDNVSGDEVWLISGKGRFSYAPSHYKASAYSIRPDTIYQIEADLKASSGIKSLEMHFFQYDSIKDKSVSNRYINPASDFKKFSLRIKTGHNTKEYRVGFRIRGKGTVTIKQIKIFEIMALPVKG
ncbi:MAG: glycosyltransferase family 39 protein [Candidatus Omnitrophica bacterium]|nr:glycosyltransferase family 39 protein [Candidatus Omnitrophota bacterium]